jgi:hypothetical protein
MRGLLLGQDAQVAAWAFATFKLRTTPIDIGIGIVEPDGTLAGAILLQNFNGYNVEFSYYGPRTLTPGIIRAVAKTVLGMGAIRLTVTVAKDKKQFIKGILRAGFTHEAACIRFYGPRDDLAAHTGMRMVMHKDELKKLAEGGCTIRRKKERAGKKNKKKKSPQRQERTINVDVPAAGI